MWTPSDLPLWLPPRWPSALLSSRWSEDPDAYELSIDLPGFRRRDVTLEVRGDVLEVRAERAKGFFTKEHHAVRHAMTLPSGADPDAVQASLRGGRLTVRVPKRPEARARTIPIRVNGELPPPAPLGRAGSPWLRAVNQLRDALRSAVDSVKAALWRHQDA